MEQKEKEGGKECMHIFHSVYYGTEWEVECKKCDRNVFEIYEKKDALNVIKSITKDNYEK
jgi:hypothetical protein